MHIEERLNEGPRIHLKQEYENETKKNITLEKGVQVDDDFIAWDSDDSTKGGCISSDVRTSVV